MSAKCKDLAWNLNVQNPQKRICYEMICYEMMTEDTITYGLSAAGEAAAFRQHLAQKLAKSLVQHVHLESLGVQCTMHGHRSRLAFPSAPGRRTDEGDSGSFAGCMLPDSRRVVSAEQ